VTNPHIYYYIGRQRRKRQRGETGPSKAILPTTLRRVGFSRDLLKARGHGERDRLGFPRWLQARRQP